MNERTTDPARTVDAHQPRRYARAVTEARDPRIPDLVSLRQAAEILGISKQAAHKRALKGQLQGTQVDGAWLFRRAVVEKAAEADAEG